MMQPEQTGRRIDRRAVIGLGFAALFAALPAFAQGIVDQIVQQLRDQGYSEISVERTWLGRTRILGQGASGQREIILNPNTGEILRDLWQGNAGNGDRIIDDDGGKGRGRGGDDGDSGGSSGSGGDDSDDDNSGSGSDDDDDDSGGGGSDDDNDGGGDGGGSGKGGGDDD